MTPAAITQAATAALPRKGHGQDSADAAARVGRFRAVLAHAARDAEPAATAALSSDGATPASAGAIVVLGRGAACGAQASLQAPASPSAQRAARQDVHALLAQISSDSPVPAANADATIATAATQASEATAPSDAPTKLAAAKAATATDVSAASAPVAMPGAFAVTAAPSPKHESATPATAPSAGLATTMDAAATGPIVAAAASVENAGGRADATRAADIGITIVGEAGHLAPGAPSRAPGERAASAVKSAGSSGTVSAAEAAVSLVADVEVSSSATIGTAGGATANATSDAHTAKANAAGVSVGDAGAHPDAAALPDGTLQAIASAVATLADETANTPSTTPPTQAAPAAASIAPARSLTLQLSPGTLGAVTVHLHMTGGGLDVRLTIEDDKTLGAISRARDELGAAIGDTGTSLASLIIQSAPASATAGSNDTTQSQSDTPTGGGGSANDSSGRGSGGDNPRRDTWQSGSAPARPPAAAARDRGGDGVFV